MSTETLPDQSPPKPAILPAISLGLGSIEFALAAWTVLLIPAEPGHAIFLGYSLQRIILFLLTSLPSPLLLLLAVRIYRRKYPAALPGRFTQNRTLLIYTSFLFALGAFIAWICPPSLLGPTGNYFERLRPLLVVAGFFPAQAWLITSIPWTKRPNSGLLLATLLGLGVLLFSVGLIVVSKLGLTPDAYNYWKLAGIPLTYLQFASILFVASLGLGIGAGLARFLPASKKDRLDLVLVIGIYLCAGLVWNAAPMVKEFYYSVHPKPPYNQPFPYSDARVHDLGALAILKGWGINFGDYTDKPLYIVFLAILHLFAGYDYNLLTTLQVWFLALIPAVLYMFGKDFHNRFFGVLIALIVLIRLQSAILLAHIVDSANPKLFITEGMTLLGLLTFTWLVFLWVKDRQAHPTLPLMAGAVLGATSLLRLNPLLLLPAVLLFALLPLWGQKRAWMFGSAALLLGFAVLVTPWIVAGRDSGGEPYLFLKFIDVLNVRYGPSSLEINPSPKAFYQRPEPGLALTTYAIPVPDLPRAAAPLIDVTRFPGFVLNHFAHNLVATFLELPDSLSISDQVLSSLVNRPYWLRSRMLSWSGEIDSGQLPFMLFNLCLLAVGLAWSWKQWRWAGFVPLLVFLAYDLALGLARNSGSRYLVPMDWIVFFYFGIGSVTLLAFLPQRLRTSLAIEPIPALTAGSAARHPHPAWLILLIVLAACLVPAANKLVPVDTSLCPSVSLKPLAARAGGIVPKGVTLVEGLVLYPDINGHDLNFTLLSCHRADTLDVPNFNAHLDNSQPVIAELLDTGSVPILEMLISPATSSQGPKILWERK